MGKSNAIVIFSRLNQLDRSARDEFYSVMPWTDVDALFSTMFEDVVDTSLRFGNADVHIFRSAKDHSDDFLGEFMKEASVHDLEGTTFGAQVAHAMEVISGGRYTQAAIVLENNPSLDEHLFRTTFQQLSHEDDCAVIGMTEEEQCYMVGIRQPDFDLFDGNADDGTLAGGVLLRRLCLRDETLVPVAEKYSLDLAPNLGRLKIDLENLAQQQPLLGRRSLQMFRNLERKYRRKNGK